MVRLLILMFFGEDTEVLDEVVVVGYGAQKKASLTSSISQIKGMRLLKIRVLLMLQSLCKVKFRIDNYTHFYSSG